MNTDNTISVTASTLDKRAMLALGVMFASLADDVPQVQTVSAPLTPAPAPIAPEAPAAINEAVDTATVFGGASTPPAEAGQVAPLAPPAAPPVPAAPLAVTGAAPVPPVPSGGTSPTPAGVTLDKNGMPWDERINTSNKAQTQGKVWKRKPGIEDDVYNGVLAELSAIMGATPPAAPPAAPAAPPTPPAAAPAPPAPPAVPAALAAPATYMELLHAVGAHLAVGAAQPITAEEVTAVCASVGLPTGLPGLASRPDLIPTVFAGCEAIWSTRP